MHLFQYELNRNDTEGFSESSVQLLQLVDLPPLLSVQLRLYLHHSVLRDSARSASDQVPLVAVLSFLTIALFNPSRIRDSLVFYLTHTKRSFISQVADGQSTVGFFNNLTSSFQMFFFIGEIQGLANKELLESTSKHLKRQRAQERAHTDIRVFWTG